MPKVSVLTPIYNTEPEHLRQAIESILNQTFTDFEFIILNDSPWNTEIEDIVLAYKDARIKYVKNDKNIGISKSRNKLLSLASGEYLAIFDHDDISLPTRLEKQVDFLDKNPMVGVVSSNTEWFPGHHKTNHPTDNLEIKKHLMFADVVAHTAMMVRKSVLDDNNIKYEEQYSPAEDYKLVLTLVDYTMFHNIPEVLVRYRFLETNTTHRQWAKMQNADALCRNFAARQYPYLYSFYTQQHVQHENKYWIRLFDLIPLIRVKQKPHKDRWYLFGFIPLVAVKR